MYDVTMLTGEDVARIRDVIIELRCQVANKMLALTDGGMFLPPYLMDYIGHVTMEDVFNYANDDSRND